MGSHTSTGEWQSFEVRMRQRRAERLLLRAEAAADAGFFDEARAALDEAQAVYPRVAGLAATAAHIAAAAARPHPIVRRRLSLQRAAVATVIVVLIVGSAAAGTWLARLQRAALPPTVITGADVELPATPDDLLRIETESVAPEIVDDLALPAPPPSPRTDAPGPELRPQLENRDLTPASAPPIPVATTGNVLPAAPVEKIAPLVVPAEPPPPAPATTPTPEPAPAAPVPSDASLVRGVLDRYAAAYTRLDVDAASAAWPRVNRGALARAFDGLASQEISLGNCQVTVTGATASAACRGTAKWTPKIGGGEHTDARTWTFDLARASGGWQIVTARVQNR